MEEVPPLSPAGAPLAGRYQLGDMLGRGAMGEVRSAWDLRLGRRVAVKVLREDVAALPGARLRFEQEARTAARLLHPHIVTVFDTGDDGPVAYLVMEQLSGWTLADDIARGPLDLASIRILGLQVLDALGAAHGIAMVHRDIKPTNLLGAGPDNWKVGDFGIAKSLEAADPGLTSTGFIVGTPAYLAPERLTGAAATTATDLYALGVVLLEAATGERNGHDGAAVRPLAARIAGVGSPGLRAIIESATEADPATRYQSAELMADGLQCLDPSASTVSTRRGRSVVAERTRVLPAIAGAGSAEGRVRPRHLWILILAAGAGVVAIIVVAALSAGHRPPGGSPASTRVPSTTVPAILAPGVPAAPLPAGTLPSAPTTGPVPTSSPTTTTTKPGTKGQGKGADLGGGDGG